VRLRVLSLFVTTVAVAATVGVVPAAADVLPDSSAYGSYLPNSPQRLLDTRLNGGAPVGPRGSVDVTPVTPTGVTPVAVVVNVTAVAPTSSGYLTAYPEGTAPLASSVNFAAGRTVANLVTVKIGDGKFRVYNGFGSTHVIVDQLGVYVNTTPGARGGGYHPLLDGPERKLDTRSDGGGQVPSGYYITVPFRNADFDSGASISAVALNVTVPNAKGSGYITLWDAAVNIPPKASTLNFTAGQTVANSAIVPTSCQPTGSCQDAVVGFYNGSSAAVDFVVDVVGFYDNGTIAGPIRFEPLAAPVRIVDSRTKLGLAGPLGTGGRASFTPPSSVVADGSPYDPAVGVDANLTLVQPTLPSYLTLWPKTGPLGKPGTSNVNAAAGQVVANHVIQELGQPGNGVNIFNYAGTSNVVVDVGGRFVRIDGGAAGTDKSRPSGPRLTAGAPSVARAAS
jgi:hypothetical protein